MESTQNMTTPPEPKTTTSRPPAKSQGPILKRAFPFNKRQHKPSLTIKRSEATFVKSPEPKISSCYLLFGFLQLATSFEGVQGVTDHFYNILFIRDGKMTRLFTADEFFYLVLLSIYLRCATVTNSCKTSIILGLQELREVLSDILFPDAIATYIESFGVVKASNDLTYIPFFRDVKSMSSLRGFIKPADVLARINISRQQDGLEVLTGLTDWSICPDIVLNYSTAVSRALKNAVSMRKVNYAEVTGRPEFLAVYGENTNDRSVLNEAFAIDKLDASQCRLGAAFRYRDVTQLSSYGCIAAAYFGAESFNRDAILSAYFLKSLKGD